MRTSLFLLGLAICAIAFYPYAWSQELETGKVLPEVPCREDPEQSYALFLPSSYTPEKKWPILYALDPAARGQVPVDLFLHAAEKHGYILAGSNNARNGPWQDVFKSLILLWNDTKDRFSLDERRIYVTGFSGGSRAASLFARVIMHPVAGIIGCGAGLAKSLIKAEQISPAYYLGIVGMSDFNYREMLLLRDRLREHGVFHRFITHRGGHDWPSEDICLRAIEWMEIVGMKNHFRAMNEDLIRTVFQKEQERARLLEISGELSRALSLYKILADTFCAWQDTRSLLAKIREIQAQDAYQRDALEENDIQKREIAYLRKFGQIFSRMEKNPEIENLESFVESFELKELKAMAVQEKASRNYFLAVRLLQGLEIDAGSKGRDFFQKGYFDKAIPSFEVAARSGSTDSINKKNIYYSLACAYARTNNEKRALINLRLAVEHGFDDIEHIKQDEDLVSLRDSEEFQKIVQKKT
jgi:tetratricopeptide (TPR) repeat protein